VENRLDASSSPLAKIGFRLEETLSAVVDRARSEIGEPRVFEIDQELRVLAATGLQWRESLSIALSCIPCPAPLVSDPDESLLLSTGDWTETLATEAEARVVLAEKPLPPSAGGSFEKAYVTGLLSSLLSMAGRRRGDRWWLAGMEWDEDLPLARIDLPDRRSILVVAARPDPIVTSGGVGIGMVTTLPADEDGYRIQRATITLIGSLALHDDLGARHDHAYSLQLSPTP